MPWLALQLPISALGVVPQALLRARWLRPARAAQLTAWSRRERGGRAGLRGARGCGARPLQLVQAAVGTANRLAVTPWRPSLAFSARGRQRPHAVVGGGLGERMLRVGDAVLQRSVIGLALGRWRSASTPSPTGPGPPNPARDRPLAGVLLPTRPAYRGRSPHAGPHRGRRRARWPHRPPGRRRARGRRAGGGAAGLCQDWVPAIPTLQAFMVVAAIAPFNQIAASAMYASGATRWQFGLTAIATALLGVLLLLLGTEDLARSRRRWSRARSSCAGYGCSRRAGPGNRPARRCAGALRPLAVTAVMVAAVVLARALIPRRVPRPGAPRAVDCRRYRVLRRSGGGARPRPPYATPSAWSRH
jgi:hypothetical protein